MSRSLRVTSGFIPQVKLAVMRNGFPSQQALAEELGLARFTISNFLNGKPIDYLNFVEICHILRLDWQEIADLDNSRLNEVSTKSRQLAHLHQEDLGEAPNVSVFYGRTEELAKLEQWIVIDRCRLVALLGMGGIGKTALSVKLAEQIQNEFDYLIWRSLRNAPPVENILVDLIKFLSNQQETDLQDTVNGKVSRLINYLRSSRCLLVLDNAESILRGGDRAGQYREGYEGYGELLRQLGELPHQSCLVLTSREKPKEIALLEGQTRPVRSLQLNGLDATDVKSIFTEYGSFSGSEDEWRVVVEYYAGNPLALKIAASAIQEILNGNIPEFIEIYLKPGKVLFDDIRDILDEQFNRLSASEKEIMYWLAINREPVSDLKLQEDIVLSGAQQKLIADLASLKRRSLIERGEAGFTLQNVVMEYMTDQLIKKVSEEIRTGAPTPYKM